MSDITIHGFKEPESKFPEKPSYTKIVLTAKKASAATLKSLNQQERAILKLALNSLSSKEGDTIACQAVIEKLKANMGKTESTTLIEKVMKGASNLFANRISSTALQESLSLISETKTIELQADLLVSQADFEGAIALLRPEVQTLAPDPTLLKRLAAVYGAYTKDPKRSSHVKSANKIYIQLNIPKKIEISNKGFGTEHRMKLASTEETKKLQTQIQGKNYDIQLDANPYIPSRSNKPDKTKAQLWIEAHPDSKSQKVATLIVDHTTHISFDTFKTALSKSVQNFNDSLQKGEKYIIAVYEEREQDTKKIIEKSNKWVVENALSSIKQLPEQVVSAKNAKMYVKTHPEIKKVLFMDDASYSGTQVSGTLMTLAPDASLAETHLIVPFMTTFALKTITEKTPHVIIHPYQKMALITEEIPDKEMVSTIDTMYFPVLEEGDSKSHTLTIFDHKIADHLSTLDEVYRYGVIRNAEGKLDDSNVQWNQNIFSTRFVPTTYPCYKSVQTK